MLKYSNESSGSGRHFPSEVNLHINKLVSGTLDNKYKSQSTKSGLGEILSAQPNPNDLTYFEGDFNIIQSQQ